jgi:cell division protein FtsN
VIYLKDSGTLRAVVSAPKSRAAKSPSPSADKSPGAAKERRFQFYEMLPKFEVVIPEEDRSARPDVAQSPVKSPGIYVLQAGSYSSFSDADRVKAQLALLGIASRIQKVSIDDKVYHRVRIGPEEDLERLNELRSQLRQGEIEVMVIRVGD